MTIGDADKSTRREEQFPPGSRRFPERNRKRLGAVCGRKGAIQSSILLKIVMSRSSFSLARCDPHRQRLALPDRAGGDRLADDLLDLAVRATLTLLRKRVTAAFTVASSMTIDVKAGARSRYKPRCASLVCHIS